MLLELLCATLPCASTVGSVVGTLLFIFVLTAAIGSDGGALSSEFPWQFRLAARLRTPVLVFIVVPLSFLQRVRTSLRRRVQLVTRGYGGPAAALRHEAKVADIERQIREWNSAGRIGKLRTARPNWASMSLKLGSNKASCHLIEISHMNDVLELDADNLTATVEPGVTMGEMTDILLPLGLALQTHVEMESVTVGGITMGFGIETNSHAVGLHQESVLEYELLDSHGKRHRVTAESDPELFYALPWSHGTIGFLLSVKVRLLRTKRFLRMVYEPTSSAEQLTAKLSEYAAMEGAPDFLEATQYDRHRAVIQAAWYAESPPAGRVANPINRFWKPFFFRYVETFLNRDSPYEEYIPLKDFLHRFTRSIFWELEDMIPFSNHPIYRCLWGWMGAPEVSLLKLFQGPVIRRASVYAHVVQESIMPIDKLPEGIEKFDEWFACYPLLVFPVRFFNRHGLSGFCHPRKELCDRLEPDGATSGLWVDLGAYGVPALVKEGKVWDAKASVRAMEHWTRDVGGFQALYTDIFCTKRELRQMFDFSLLDLARERLGAIGCFPEVYDKVRSEDGISDLSDIVAAEAEADQLEATQPQKKTTKRISRLSKSPTKSSKK